ncbi:MAG: hypothetical protein EON54_12580 [Alcaligenaceae bacterium]|nr:MAG: hypothetical protein EON54_12580 [Alcaligenaceae bacterium]
MQILFAELGVCVHIYQRIEVLLKVLLPHLIVPGTDVHAPGEGFENWRVLLDSKKTLGELVRLFGQRVESANAQAFEDAWRRLVDERNEVVHHFAEQSFSRLETKAQYRSAVLFLKTRREAAIPVFEMLDEFGRAFFASVQEGNRAV